MRHIHTFSAQIKFELASQAQCIAIIAISPFALIAELYRLSKGSIHASTCLANICLIPKHIILSIVMPVLYIVRALNEAVTAASRGVGFLAWHGGERMVSLINDSPSTVLSYRPEIRDIVYDSIGLTLLAAAAVFVPLAPIQLVALPIILGSIYGTVNNQFTIRECPEYYTMGHYYDGTDLKGHAIKTNNLIIKPIVTGCYATTIVTKIAGVILAAVGRLPYTAAVLPVSYAAVMIAGVIAVSLVAAHVFSNMAKKAVQNNLHEYAALLGIPWTDDLQNKSWSKLQEMGSQKIEEKRQEFTSDKQGLEKFNQKLRHLTKRIGSGTSNPHMPIKYIIGWQANGTRNVVGYIFAGGGILVLSATTIFLRIYLL